VFRCEQIVRTFCSISNLSCLEIDSRLRPNRLRGESYVPTIPLRTVKQSLPNPGGVSDGIIRLIMAVCFFIYISGAAVTFEFGRIASSRALPASGVRMNIYSEGLVSNLGRPCGSGREQRVRAVNLMIARAFRIQSKTKRWTCYKAKYEIPYGQPGDSQCALL